MQVTPGDLVSFTFVGMADKVVKVQAGKKVMNVKMETNATALADVVVTGYQTLLFLIHLMRMKTILTSMSSKIPIH